MQTVWRMMLRLSIIRGKGKGFCCMSCAISHWLTNYNCCCLSTTCHGDHGGVPRAIKITHNSCRLAACNPRSTLACHHLHPCSDQVKPMLKRPNVKSSNPARLVRNQNGILK